MVTLWVCEKIKRWEKSLIARLCNKYPVFLVEGLEKLVQPFSIKSGPVLKGHLLIDLDSLCLAVDEAKKINTSIKTSGYKLLLSRSFPPAKHQNLLMPLDRSEYCLHPEDALLNVLPHLNKSAKQDNHMHGSIRYKTVEFSFEKMFLRSLPDGEPESLPLKEARLLKVLLQNPTKVWTRQELQDAVWDKLKVSPRTIDSHISRLRKKLQYTDINIESKYGGGYTIS